MRPGRNKLLERFKAATKQLSMLEWILKNDEVQTDEDLTEYKTRASELQICIDALMHDSIKYSEERKSKHEQWMKEFRSK